MTLAHPVRRTHAPGSPAPGGYLAWHEWAEAQSKAGLKQQECGRCGLWEFPQELSKLKDVHTLTSKKGTVRVETPVCLKCAEADPHPKGPAGFKGVDVLPEVAKQLFK